MLARCIPCGSPWPRWLSLWTESLLCLSLSLCVSFFSVLLSGWSYVVLWEDDLARPKLNKIKRHRIFMFHKIIVGYQNFVTIDGILWLRSKNNLLEKIICSMYKSHPFNLKQDKIWQHWAYVSVNITSQLTLLVNTYNLKRESQAVYKQLFSLT